MSLQQKQNQENLTQLSSLRKSFKNFIAEITTDEGN
jgi:ribosomal protein S20